MSIAPSYLPDAWAATVFAAAQDRPLLHHPMVTRVENAESDERANADAQLLRRMSTGDRDALAELYNRFSRPLYSTALHILNDASEAQDVTHDVFISLWEKSALFESGRGTAFSWAVTLLRNRSIDRIRTRQRHARLLDEAALTDLGYDETAGDTAADDRAASGDDASAVRAAVATLPPEQRRALDLAFFKGLTQQEIAEKLQEPLGTVKARIRRGLHKLRDTLARRL